MDADAWMHAVIVRDLPSGFMVLSELPFKRNNVYYPDLNLSSLTQKLRTDHKSQKNAYVIVSSLYIICIYLPLIQMFFLMEDPFNVIHLNVFIFPWMFEK